MGRRFEKDGKKNKEKKPSGSDGGASKCKKNQQPVAVTAKTVVDDTKKLGPANRSHYTTILQVDDIRTLDAKPVVTVCYENCDSKEKTLYHIYVSRGQPNHGFICGCGMVFFGWNFWLHVKKCPIAIKLEDGGNPSGGSNEVGRWQKATINKEQYDKLVDPVFASTRDGKLLIHYHHKLCWACAGCGHRSESWKSIMSTHVNDKVRDPSDPKGKKFMDPVEYTCSTPNTWSSLQPNLDTCKTVKAKTVICNYVKKEDIKKKKPKKKGTLKQPSTAIDEASVKSASTVPPAMGMAKRTRSGTVE